MKAKRIREEMLGAISGIQNITNPVVPNCKILGLASKNKRRYLREAISEALPLYESAEVYFDHNPQESGKSRPFIQKFGKLENARLDANGELIADLRYNPRHLWADTFRGWLESDTSAIGFSHDALAMIREDANGEEIVEKITKVTSVDLVSRPAATKGLFESDGDNMDPDLMTEGGDSGADHKAKLGELISSIVADSSLSMDEKRKKVLGALKLMDEGEAKEGEEEEAKEGEDEKPEDKEKVKEAEDEEEKKDEKVEEALKTSKDPNVKRLLESLDRYKVADKIRNLEVKSLALCEKHRLAKPAITDVFVRQLCEARDDNDRVKLIEDRKSVAHGISKKPTSQAPSGGKKLTVDDLIGGL